MVIEYEEAREVELSFTDVVHELKRHSVTEGDADLFFAECPPIVSMAWMEDQTWHGGDLLDWLGY